MHKGQQLLNLTLVMALAKLACITKSKVGQVKEFLRPWNEDAVADFSGYFIKGKRCALKQCALHTLCPHFFCPNPHIMTGPCPCLPQIQNTKPLYHVVLWKLGICMENKSCEDVLHLNKWIATVHYKGCTTLPTISFCASDTLCCQITLVTT